jgi:hypothetical protein
MKTIFLAVSLATSIPTALAAQTAPVAAPSAAALAKAGELMVVMNTRDLLAKTLDAQAGIMTKGLADQILRSGVAPAEVANDSEFRGIMQRYLDRISLESNAKLKVLVPQIVDRMTAIYARNFSVAQIDDLMAFYRTPTGRDFLAKTPALTAEAAEVTRELTTGPMMDVVKNVMPQMVADLQAWGEKHKAAEGKKQ